MKFKIFSAILACSLSQTALATSSNLPTTCPSVDAIKNVGVTSVSQKNNRWIALEWKHLFETDYEWTFAVGDFKAKNPSEVLAQANAALSKLKFQSGPFYSDEEDPEEKSAICFYEISSRLYGMAISPALEPKLTQIIDRMKLIKNEN